jgi:hypothetical protein
MDLLQITAMDATFALKDVIYIVTGVGAAVGTEKTEEKNKTELDAINAEITEVKLGISTINGKLDILINK